MGSTYLDQFQGVAAKALSGPDNPRVQCDTAAHYSDQNSFGRSYFVAQK